MILEQIRNYKSMLQFVCVSNLQDYVMNHTLGRPAIIGDKISHFQIQIERDVSAELQGV